MNRRRNGAKVSAVLGVLVLAASCRSIIDLDGLDFDASVGSEAGTGGTGGGCILASCPPPAAGGEKCCAGDGVCGAVQGSDCRPCLPDPGPACVTSQAGTGGVAGSGTGGVGAAGTGGFGASETGGVGATGTGGFGATATGGFGATGTGGFGASGTGGNVGDCDAAACPHGLAGTSTCCVPGTGECGVRYGGLCYPSDPPADASDDQGVPCDQSSCVSSGGCCVAPLGPCGVDFGYGFGCEPVDAGTHGPQLGSCLDAGAGAASLVEMLQAQFGQWVVDDISVYAATKLSRELFRISLPCGPIEKLADLPAAPDAMAVNADAVFLTMGNLLYRVDKSTGTLGQVANEGGVPLVVDATHAFFGSGGVIRSVALSDGMSDVVAVAAGASYGGGIALTSSNIYFVGNDGAQDGVFKVPKQGGVEPSLVVAGLPSIGAAGDTVVLAEVGRPFFVMVEPGVPVEYPFPAAPSALAVASDAFYGENFSPKLVARYALADGGAPSAVAPSAPSGQTDVHVNTNWVFWLHTQGIPGMAVNEIWRAPR